MKIELMKETSFQGIFFWVKIDESVGGAAKCFSDTREQEAKEYLEMLVSYYEKHGNLDNISETIISKEVTYNPPSI